MKSNKKTKKTIRRNLDSIFKMLSVKLKRALKFAIIKTDITNTRTRIKFIGLDLLKTLVIINSFCIFAS